MSLGQRLKTAREAKKLTQLSLAQRSGVSQQLISRLEGGHIESTTEIFPLADTLGVDARWLATGQGSMRDGSEENASKPLIHVPVVSWVAAGNWREMIEDDEHKSIAVTCKVGRNAYALQIKGDSMEPVFPNGSYIVVDPDLEPRPGNYVVVRLNETHEATFKQLIVEGGIQYLKPLNPRYPIMEVRQEASFCGVVRHMEMGFG
ncbi:LexA family protein [Methylogaea oryzae]|uniref:Peptidase n=1 Tax=Methylogaea oryzae TaxID=1295382 RepID=A0A8D5AH51_9GAMM|nr:XRE family transcriptional regulator [Methylogaea oryzae]BBL71098.1 peptidase [Methylogaea oryzae]